jgi:transcriptional regulator with XRE-family HTH domain
MKEVPRITPRQCTAARGLLRWTVRRLAEESGVTFRTIVDFENEKRAPISATLQALQAAFERGGVEFIWPNGGGPGVREKSRT